MDQYYVYIMANEPYGILYTGVAKDLIHRVQQHRTDELEGFTKKYGVHLLVHFEPCADAWTAAWREKCIKYWHREWKIKLIEEDNPGWRDLYPELLKR